MVHLCASGLKLFSKAVTFINSESHNCNFFPMLSIASKKPQSVTNNDINNLYITLIFFCFEFVRTKKKVLLTTQAN